MQHARGPAAGAVTLRLAGGLGNQLFQYAAGHALAERVGVPLRLDANWHARYGGTERPYWLHTLNVPEEAEFPAPASRLGRLRHRIARVVNASARPRMYQEPHFHYDPAFARLRAPIVVNGYFQSWRYFAGYEDGLRERFRPHAALSDNAAAIARAIDAARVPVSLHVRGGDYLEPAVLAVHGVMSPGYYRQATDVLRKLAGADVSFFVFSDDPASARAKVRAEGAVTFVPPQRPWEDLHLMARCRHHIIANSTFSWWGAWLNPRHKIVIAPRNWFTPLGARKQDARDLMPADWTQI